jgi:hypothetical protein
MIITGIRGVGKTVLLNNFRETAERSGWVVIDMEVSKHDDNELRFRLSQEFRRALLTLSPRNRWKERTAAAASILKSFTLSVDPDGKLTAGLDVDARPGQADSGSMELDLVDMILALGHAAKENNTGMLLLIDEVQFLTTPQMESLIQAIHKCVQRSLPFAMVGAGLPQIAELAGEAKSYAERLFRFPRIDRFCAEDSGLALSQPAKELDVELTAEALELGFKLTGGYPYFIQELGYAVWPLAQDNLICADDVANAGKVMEAKLDSSFFRVRLDRVTDLERAYLRAMAELGPDPQSAVDVAALLSRTSEQCGPTRSSLIGKGLLYTPQHGYASFTVPHFDRFMKRAVPELTAPPLQKRRKRSQ